MSDDAKDVRVVLVTGANKGIGKEVARRMVEAGYRVYLGARNPERGQAAAEAVGATFLQLDVTSNESVASAAKAVQEMDGRLDVLVNNAGLTGPIRDVADYTADDLAEVLNTNVVGYVRMIQAFLPLLTSSADARIVNVSSGLGSFALVHDENRIESQVPALFYGASKAAINMLSVRYARLLPNMRVNVADPGITATDLSDGRGHSVREGSDAIVALAFAPAGGPTGSFRDREGDLSF